MRSGISDDDRRFIVRQPPSDLAVLSTDGTTGKAGEPDTITLRCDVKLAFKRPATATRLTWGRDIKQEFILPPEYKRENTFTLEDVHHPRSRAAPFLVDFSCIYDHHMEEAQDICSPCERGFCRGIQSKARSLTLAINSSFNDERQQTLASP